LLIMLRISAIDNFPVLTFAFLAIFLSYVNIN